MGRDDAAVPPGALSPFPPPSGPVAGAPQVIPSPYDAAALRATVALLRGRLGDQLISLSAGCGANVCGSADGGSNGADPRRAGFGGTAFSSLQS